MKLLFYVSRTEAWFIDLFMVCVAAVYTNMIMEEQNSSPTVCTVHCQTSYPHVVLTVANEEASLHREAGVTIVVQKSEDHIHTQEVGWTSVQLKKRAQDRPDVVKRILAASRWRLGVHRQYRKVRAGIRPHLRKRQWPWWETSGLLGKVTGPLGTSRLTSRIRVLSHPLPLLRCVWQMLTSRKKVVKRVRRLCGTRREVSFLGERVSPILPVHSYGFPACWGFLVWSAQWCYSIRFNGSRVGTMTWKQVLPPALVHYGRCTLSNHPTEHDKVLNSGLGFLVGVSPWGHGCSWLSTSRPT